MSVPKGKIVCIAGQVGSGAAEVVNALAGLAHDATGDVRVNGEPFSAWLGVAGVEEQYHVHLRRPRGGGRVPAVVYVRQSGGDEAGRLCASAVFFAVARCAQLRSALAAQVGVDRRRMWSVADELSGGNQQKLAFGRCVDRGEAGVLVMNEPTRGIDVGARADIYRIMREFCAQGLRSRGLTSSDLEEIVGLGDIVITMYRGKRVGVYSREEVTMHRVVSDITHPLEGRLTLHRK